MRILYVINSGKPGGMEHHVRLLIKGMVNLGHEVHVWCAPGEIVAWYEQLGAKVTQKTIKHDIDISYIKELCSYISLNKIEVVHGHELKAVVNSLLAAYFCKVGARVSHTHTPMSEWQIFGIKRILLRIEIFGYAGFVNAFSKAEIALTPSRKSVKRREGIKEDKLRVIPNCIEDSVFSIDDETRIAYRKEIRNRYNIPEEAFLIGNVSRLSEEKGQSILLKAFAKTEDQYLLLAGGGSLENYLKNLADDLNIADRVRFTGMFTQDDLVKFYSAFDMFVFPTLAEGFGLVLIEAMRSSLPIIASDLDVLKEVGADTISYFRAGSEQDLSRFLNNFTTNGKNILNNEKAKQRVEALYTERIFSKNYEDLYNELIKG